MIVKREKKIALKSLSITCFAKDPVLLLKHLMTLYSDNWSESLLQKILLWGVKEAGELFLTQYKSDKQQFEGMTPYQIQIVDTILLENDALISLQRSGTEYLGGAHPVNWATLMNFKASDGTFFPQEELFTDMGKILGGSRKSTSDETFNISDGRKF